MQFRYAAGFSFLLLFSVRPLGFELDSGRVQRRADERDRPSRYVCCLYLHNRYLTNLVKYTPGVLPRRTHLGRIPALVAVCDGPR